LLGNPPLRGDGEEPVEIGVAGAWGGEEELLAVSREAQGHVRAGVIGETPGHPPRSRDHVDVGVPVVLTGEGEPRTVRGEDGPRLGAHGRRETPRLAAVAADDPQVLGVGERDLGAADGGSP